MNQIVLTVTLDDDGGVSAGANAAIPQRTPIREVGRMWGVMLRLADAGVATAEQELVRSMGPDAAAAFMRGVAEGQFEGEISNHVVRSAMKEGRP